MRKANVELTLYSAHCHADGCSEGPFDPNAIDKHSSERYMKAMETVQKYVGLGRDFFEIKDFEGFVQNDEEAQKLIDFAENNIPGATGITELVKSYHERLFFRRKIRFEGENDPGKILQEIKKSGYIPRWPSWEGAFPYFLEIH